MNKEIEIPEGYEARIEGNKVIIELKESEDERIRKAITRFISESNHSHVNFDGQSITKKECLFWLEKQKEGNLVERKYVQEAYKKGLDWGLRQKEQKPAEWSEKDSSMLCDIVGYITGAGSSSGITKQERVDFLYGLPKRFNLQPKQEWSEEDEKMLNELLDHCNTKNAEWYNWLKSLRPHPHWKPSEEQMEALKEAMYQLDGSEYSDGIDSLFNDIRML